MVKKRSIVYIDEDDFKFCQKLIKNKNYFKNNIHLFTLATLIGKYVIKRSKSIPAGKKKDFFRTIDNLNDDNMIILKCIAISSLDNIAVLNNEDELFSYCEMYANAGIKELRNWDDLDFDTELSNVLIEAWDKIDLSALDDL